ncbi:ribosome quality control complex subunit TCF25 isoform X2 [Lepeophtheirus salmonis]|uniref:ribosome quality control complex subunit TCF25 isoform X2 n=1 Tax=Lepeophtheirus salmonis TaxID=72036 RepID=UPI003AF38125
MSSRALRRFQGSDEFIKVGGDLKDEEEDEDLDTPPRKFNPFALLNNDEISPSESEVKEDDDQESRSEVNLEHCKNAEKTKKRKKNRKRAPGKHISAALKSSEDNLEIEDEIEKSIRDVNKILGDSNENDPSTSSFKLGVNVKKMGTSLLSIDPKNLNHETEMKKIFGSRVVQAEQQKHHHYHHHGKARPRNRPHHIRSNHWLVVPKSNWPKPGKTGLMMKFLKSEDDGAQYFTFDHNEEYRMVQLKFFEAVDSLHPDFIVQLLHEHPYHIDTMLQLSNICKMSENTDMATELVERALFAMESAFHPLFNLAVDSCRIDYNRQENRAFFIALFRHLNFVGSRACYRTALEFCKLILSLDPESDPLGIFLLVDFYAIRSRQFSWFIDFFNEYEQSRNLIQLPNFAYSIALAYFHYSQEKKTESAELEAKADEYLQKALIMFPGILLPLMDKCSIEPDVEISSETFFIDSQINQSPALQILSSLYIGRSYHLWKEPKLLPWLSKNAQTVKSIAQTKCNKLIEESAEKRKTRYQGTPRNIYRHVIMSEIKDATASLPRELTEDPILSYDPLPPTDSIDAYVRNAKTSQNEDSSTFQAFFRSLLPSYNIRDQQTNEWSTSWRRRRSGR